MSGVIGWRVTFWSRLPRLEAVPRLNWALNVFEARLLQAINRQLPTWDEAGTAGNPERYWSARALRERLLTILRENTVMADSPSLHALVSPADRDQIRRRFEGPNRLLAEKYGVRISEPAEARPVSTALQRDPGPIPSGVAEAIVALLGENAAMGRPNPPAHKTLAKAGLNFLQRALNRMRN